MAPQHDPLAHAQHTAHEWLNVIAARLGTDDRDFAYRALRAWLHLVRDRLSVDSAAHLAAQLPEFLRGVYFEGWAPSRVPIRYDSNQFTSLFAREAGIGPADVPDTAAAVSGALRERFSPGQLDHVFAVLPAGLRGQLEGEVPVAAPAPRAPAEQLRLTALEDTVQALTEAVSALARGLEEPPGEEPGGGRAAKAAQEAHRILMAQTVVAPGT
ncbi:DUF2267 domain-containing protein [Amycolatopsis taiwanensis]|uniref:DUF2267 domain-containing protein n=1 Tax=Amycolatopsis taiwanensis TaxID=342230 RepID=A0A9W6VD67_9PSEU|nr:DUF2267 domain-containing protein [Amycolatopsis taiwanensis]GLY66968.1 hypothetical protein Atai01_35870 [Amycolatopsis taiwanensis]